jgi:hypothetical protein
MRMSPLRRGDLVTNYSNRMPLGVEFGRLVAECLCPVQPSRRTTSYCQASVGERAIQHAGAVCAAGRPELHCLLGSLKFSDVLGPL